MHYIDMHCDTLMRAYVEKKETVFRIPEFMWDIERMKIGGCLAQFFAIFDYFWQGDDNLKILLGFVQSPYFTAETVAKEQGIIGQEIRMYDDEPNAVVYYNALRAMYSEHPLKVDIAGTVESVNRIDKEALYSCYNTFYNPANMVLCVVGGIDHEKVAEIVEKNIKKIIAQDGE